MDAQLALGQLHHSRRQTQPWPQLQARPRALSQPQPWMLLPGQLHHSRRQTQQSYASQAPAAGVVAEGMRSAAPRCTEIVTPSTEAASAATNSAARLPLSTSASLADDLPPFRIVDDHPFYFCSPRGCFVAFPPGQVGTCAVPIPRARAQRAERPVSIHAHALPTVNPSPRRPTGSGTVNVTFSVKGQVRMAPSCNCAALSPSGPPMAGL